jgi:hypothetical protein
MGLSTFTTAHRKLGLSRISLQQLNAHLTTAGRLKGKLGPAYYTKSTATISEPAKLSLQAIRLLHDAIFVLLLGSLPHYRIVWDVRG